MTAWNRSLSATPATKASRARRWCSSMPVRSVALVIVLDTNLVAPRLGIQGDVMEQLSGLDAAFLAMESSTVHGHIGSVTLLEPTAGTEELTLSRLTALLQSRLHRMPPFRRRLVSVPLGLDQPYWIDDPEFDIEF